MGGDWVWVGVDEVEEGGNVGRMMGIGEWFGIEDILCWEGSGEGFNGKRVEGRMGGVGGVRVD